MTELTKKVVEAGLVTSQSVRLLKMWRCCPDDMPEVVAEERTQEELLVFVEQIEELLDEKRGMAEMRETELDLQHLIANDPRVVYASCGADTLEMTIGITRSGQLVFPVGEGRVQETVCRRGNTIRISSIEDVVVVVTHVEPRYVGEELKFYLCDVVPRDA